jgi:hypothetical protein
MLKYCVPLTVLALCSCRSLDPNVTGGSNISSPQELFDAVNSRYAGRPFNEVVLRYGQPSGSVPFRNNVTVYQFPNSASVRMHEQTTTDTVGVVGTTAAYVPYAQQSTGWQGYNQQMSCTMRVGVRPDGTVDGLDFVGQMGACQVFMP